MGTTKSEELLERFSLGPELLKYYADIAWYKEIITNIQMY